MAHDIDQTFTDATVSIDGNIYERCTIRRCTLQFGASGSGGGFLSNTFDDCRWTFTGAAAETMHFLAILGEAPERGNGRIRLE